MKWWSVEVITGYEGRATEIGVKETSIPIIASVLVRASSIVNALTRVLQDFPGKEIIDIHSEIYAYVILQGE